LLNNPLTIYDLRLPLPSPSHTSNGAGRLRIFLLNNPLTIYDLRLPLPSPSHTLLHQFKMVQSISVILVATAALYAASPALGAVIPVNANAATPTKSSHLSVARPTATSTHTGAQKDVGQINRAKNHLKETGHLGTASHHAHLPHQTHTHTKGQGTVHDVHDAHNPAAKHLPSHSLFGSHPKPTKGLHGNSPLPNGKGSVLKAQPAHTSSAAAKSAATPKSKTNLQQEIDALYKLAGREYEARELEDDIVDLMARDYYDFYDELD